MLLTRIIFACLLGALLNLDTVSFGQFQLSRPVVLGAILGSCLGDYFNGLVFGALLELIWAGCLPIGGNIPPDVCLMGTLGVIWLTLANCLVGWQGHGFMAVLIVLVIPIGYAGNASESWMRRYNNNFIRQAEKYIEEGEFKKIYRLKWQGLLLNYGRLLAVLSLFVLPVYLTFYFWEVPLRHWGTAMLSGYLVRPLEVFYYLLPALGLAVLMSLFYIKELAWYLWGGFLWGFILVSVLQMNLLSYSIYTLGIMLILTPILYLLVVKKGVEWW